ncbi:23S rRNA (adenine(2030)-N(6))-methyltransferase RlmJ [Reinekea sp.]|uniref:23S rRNA (adenine(2030)-N(6))-methyltransferase RlmJ n=1 Tax=Reinekea sp. TaxID=1970455 RepID=UPI003989DB27
MLSYRHSFHAGNYADILKHIVLIECLEHLLKKDKPFDYIDTHSGAGLFDLKSEHALKLEEHVAGISKLKRKNYPELSSYFSAIDAVNPSGGIQYYPGSPAIAKHFLRKIDRAWLYELHPADVKTLTRNMSGHRKTRIECSDGLKGLIANTPPVSRRGLVLIDPSYELKNEYEKVFSALKQAYQKFPSGTYALWYPVVERRKIETLCKKFASNGIKNAQRFEFGITPDSNEHGMTSAGMIVVNPPWTLFDKMSKLLPKLSKQLSEGQKELYRCDVLTKE